MQQNTVYRLILKGGQKEKFSNTLIIAFGNHYLSIFSICIWDKKHEIVGLPVLCLYMSNHSYSSCHCDIFSPDNKKGPTQSEKCAFFVNCSGKHAVCWTRQQNCLFFMEAFIKSGYPFA